MHDLDHMLNGTSSRQHHQDMIREVQYERLAREVEASGKITAHNTHKAVKQIRTTLAAIMNTVAG